MDAANRFVAHLNGPAVIAAALLVLAVIVVIKVGKVLLMAGIFGVALGAVSLARGLPPATAASHAAVGFGVAAVTLFLVKFTKSLLMWLAITAVGIGVLILFGFVK